MGMKKVERSSLRLGWDGKRGKRDLDKLCGHPAGLEDIRQRRHAMKEVGRIRSSTDVGATVLDEQGAGEGI